MTYSTQFGKESSSDVEVFYCLSDMAKSDQKERVNVGFVENFALSSAGKQASI